MYTLYLKMSQYTHLLCARNKRESVEIAAGCVCVCVDFWVVKFTYLHCPLHPLPPPKCMSLVTIEWSQHHTYAACMYTYVYTTPLISSSSPVAVPNNGGVIKNQFLTAIHTRFHFTRNHYSHSCSSPAAAALRFFRRPPPPMSNNIIIGVARREATTNQPQLDRK